MCSCNQYYIPHYRFQHPKMKTQAAIILVGLLTYVSPQAAAPVQVPDGVIVPFSSVLPACASSCGPLFDVQGACSPPNIPAVSQTCFCGDARLTPFITGYSEVSAVCGPASCTDTADLAAVQSWYETYCGEKAAATTTSSGAASTGTGSSSSGKTSPNTNQGW